MCPLPTPGERRPPDGQARQEGPTITPVQIEGRQIAHTFWGKAWCENLESYSDFANRLPRGRTYVRNGSVVDLQIEPGEVTAMVSGSALYGIDIKIKPLQQAPLAGASGPVRRQDRLA